MQKRKRTKEKNFCCMSTPSDPGKYSDRVMLFQYVIKKSESNNYIISKAINP